MAATSGGSELCCYSIQVCDPTCAPPQTSTPTTVTGPANNPTKPTPSTTQTNPPPQTQSGTTLPPPGTGNDTKAQDGDPIRVANGQFGRTEFLLHLPGRGMDLDISLTYDALWNAKADFGRHWDLNLNQRLFVIRSLIGNTLWAEYYPGDHRKIVFRPTAYPGFLEATNGHFEKLVIVGNTYTVRSPDGIERIFSGSLYGNTEIAWLDEIVDKNQNSILIQRHPSKRIESVIDTLGNVVQFAYYDFADYDAGTVLGQNIGKLKTIVDPTGRVWSFSYNLNEDLESISYPASPLFDKAAGSNQIGQAFAPVTKSIQSRFEYNYYGFLTKILEDSDFPNASLINVYGTNLNTPLQWGRILEQTDAKGAKWKFFYWDSTIGVFNPTATNQEKMQTITLQPDGRPVWRNYNGGGQTLIERRYSNIVSASAILANTPLNQVAASWTLVAETRYSYDGDGRVIQIVHPEGNIENFLYDSFNPDRFQQGNLLQIVRQPGPRGDGGTGTGAPDQVTSFTYEPFFNQLTSVTDPMGRTTHFDYDYQEPSTLHSSLVSMAGKWLIGGTPPLGLGDVNGDGSTGGSGGDIVCARDPQANLADLTLPGNPPITQTASTLLRTNNFGQLIWVQDPEGAVTTLDYYSSGSQLGRLQRVTRDISSLAASTDFTWDGLGRLLTRSDPRGVVASYTWTPLDRISNLRLASAIDPAKGAAYGLSPIVDYEARFYYDLGNNLARLEWKRLAAPGASHWVTQVRAYDGMNNLVRVDEQVSATPLATRSTVLAYDGLNRLTQILTPAAVVAAPGSPDAFNTRSITYNALGLPCQIVRGAGSGQDAAQTFVYDRNGNLIQAYDAAINGVGNSDGLVGCAGYPALGERWDFVYDGFDRHTQSHGPLGEQLLTGYDENGNRIFTQAFGVQDGAESSIVPLISSRTFFDEKNRPVRSERDYFIIGGGAIADDYDQDGIVQSLFFYDHNDRLRATQNDNGHTSTFTWDALGRLITSTDPSGNRRSFGYDPSGNLTLLTQLDLATNGAPSSTFQVALQYDALNHLVKTVDSAGRAGYRVPDYAGRALLQADANGPSGGTSLPGLPGGLSVNLPGNVIRQVFDDLGRPVQVDRFLTASGLGDGLMPPAAAAWLTTKTVFDRNDRVERRIDPKNNETRYFFDSFDRIATETSANNLSKQFEYDADNNLTLLTQEDGTVLEILSGSQNLPESVNTLFAASGVAAVTQQFRYDGLGRTSFASDAIVAGPLGLQTSAFSRSFDSLGQLRSEGATINGAPLGTTTSAFDGSGNRTALLYPDGTSLTFGFDASQRMRTISKGAATFASYDFIGARLLKRQVFTGSTTLELSAQYDGALQATHFLHKKNGSQLLAGLNSVFDRIGNRLSETRLEEGTKGDAIRLDSAYRMTNFKFAVANANAEALVPGSGGSATDALQFAYDAADNRLLVSSTAGTASYDSNVVNEITNVGGVATSHDLRGNMLTKGPGAPAFAYDSLNRLASIAAGGQTRYFLRDATGRIRIETRFDGSTLTSYQIVQHDGAHRIQETEYPTSGAPSSRRFLYGANLDELLSVESSASPALYPLASPLGSTVALADASGNIVERYRYADGFGKPQFLNAAGNPIAASAYSFDRLFASARFDAASGAYDMRNRFYDPQLGRFLSRDPMGIWFDGMNRGNGYGYVGNNPFNFRDPFGLWGDGGGRFLEGWFDRAMLSTEKILDEGCKTIGDVFSIQWQHWVQGRKNASEKTVHSAFFRGMRERAIGGQGPLENTLNTAKGIVTGAASSVYHAAHGLLTGDGEEFGDNIVPAAAIVIPATRTAARATGRLKGALTDADAVAAAQSVAKNGATGIAENLANSVVKTGVGSAKKACLEALRKAYRTEVENLKAVADEMLNRGVPAETVAKTVSDARRGLGVIYKDATPWLPRSIIYLRNILRYGDPLGPSFDKLLKQGKSPIDIIDSACRPGGGDLGL